MSLLKIQTTEELDLEFYFRVLALLAFGDDDHVDEHEESFIRAQAALYTFDVDPYLKEKPRKSDLKLATAHPSRETALSIIRDGLAISYINGVFHKKQRKILRKLAPKLGLNKSDVDSLDDWLQEYQKVLKRGNKILLGG